MLNPETPGQSDAAASTNTEMADESPNTESPITVDDKEVATKLCQRKEACKSNRRERATNWKRNIDLRIGTIASQFTDGIAMHGGDDIRTSVNPDWSLTKTKTANLFSQVPQVQLTHENDQFIPAIQPFAKALNYELSDKRANCGPAMEEALNDVVNASGVAFIYVDYIARYDVQTVPADSLSGAPETSGVPKMVSDKFRIRRKSPTDGLWPVEFVNSDFNEADFVGYSDRWSWADSVNEWPELLKIPNAKEKILQGVEQKVQDDLRENPERANRNQEPKVVFDHLFYWRARVDPDEKHLNCIWEVVYMQGLDEPIVHRQWKGQQIDEQSNQYVGSTKFPVQILTITYITDNPIPPSDSEAARSQVNDLRRSRAQMFMNRERSLPMRWFDVNRVDPLVQDSLMRGVFQTIIPTNGDGSKSFGEVARAAYPPEDFEFDTRTKADLMESWMIGPNQQGTQGPDETATQAQITQSNFTTRVGQERNAVARFFTNICEVLAGLMSLHSTYPTLSQAEKDQMAQAWNQRTMLGDVVFRIRPDSQIVLDSGARTQKLAQFLNLTVKSGYVDPMPILIEMAELAGLDPTKVVKPPTPPDKDVPQMSIRFTGKEDLSNNLVMGLLVKHQMAPSATDLETATNILSLSAKAAQEAMNPDNPDGTASFAPPAPPGPPGAPGAGGPPGPGGPGAPPPGAPAKPTAPIPQTAHSGWQLGDRVAKRSRDSNG